jgi:hypothetical protein
MSVSDFVIHIDEKLNEFDVNEVEEAVATCAGVVSAHVSTHHPHLMLVAYDPMRGHPASALGAIRSLGLHGQMIGL